MFNRILVPLDGSPLAERAIPHAAHFARIFGSKITLLQVLDPAPYREKGVTVEPLNWQIEKTSADLYLKGIAVHLREQGIQVDHIMREGRTAENIIDYAVGENMDLVVLCSHGASGLTRWNNSSVVTKVLEKVYLPVLLIRAYQARGSTGAAAPVTQNEADLRRTVPASAEDAGGIPVSGGGIGPANQAAVDISHTAISDQTMPQLVDADVQYRRILLPIDSSRRAECSLPAGIGLAEGEKNLYTQAQAGHPEQAQENAEQNHKRTEQALVLAAILPPPQLPIPAPYPEEIQQLSDQFVKVSREAVHNYLEELQNRISTTTENRIIENESISAAIHDLVEKEDIDLVLLCAHGQTGSTSWPYGSVARNYLEYGVCPVLVIQDVPRSQVRQTPAELAAEKYGRR